MFKLTYPSGKTRYLKAEVLFAWLGFDAHRALKLEVGGGVYVEPSGHTWERIE